MIVRMKDNRWPTLRGQPSLARFLPNSIRRSRLSARRFTLLSAVMSDAMPAAFDRRGGFRTSMHVFIVQVDQIAKRTNAARRAWFGRSILRSISSAHSSPSLRRRNVSATQRILRWTRTRQFPDANCVKVATRVHSGFRAHYVCTEKSKRVQTCAISSSLECPRSLFIPLKV